MYKQYTFSECISKANYFQNRAYQLFDRAIEGGTSIFFSASERHMRTSAKWFELARLASEGIEIIAKEIPFSVPMVK